MPLIKNATTAATTIISTETTTTTTTATLIDEITKTGTTPSTHKQKENTAKTINETSTNNNKSGNKQQQQQQQQQQHQRINDVIPTTAKTSKRRKRYSSSNKNKKHKTSLVPATPVQVNPLTTNYFVPSSPDFYDNKVDVDDDDGSDDDVLYMPPYTYPNCSLDILNGDYYYDHDFDFNPPQAKYQLQPGNVAEGKEKEHFGETLADNHPLELHRDNDEDSSSMAMITPPPPYDTPYSKLQQQQAILQTYPQHPSHRYAQQHRSAYTAPKAQRSHNGTHTRKYIFNNNREQFNISSSNGNSSSNSIQQQPQSSSLGSTLTNAITPTKLSAAAAAMFAAPQMVQLNRKWSNLHRKRRRRNSSSGDSKELDKLVLQSVDWDENDIY